MNDVLAQQKDYYRARAPEYDDWWFRRGRYDRGPEAAAEWFADAAEVERALHEFAPRGDVLELAGGTGLWTQHLVRHADSLTVVDSSREMLELNRARVGDAKVDYVAADIFTWEPSRRYDVCFFGFWLSHVPERRFAGFWDSVAAALQPGGRVFLVDSTRSDAAHTAVAAASPDHQIRSLADGREFEIVKRFYAPDDLSAAVAALGWRLHAVVAANGHMLYGSGARA